MREVKILGEVIPVKFCMAVEIAYEEISGVPFQVGDLSMQKASAALYMAAILTAKPDTAITVERLMNEASGPEIAALSQAVVESMQEWMELPAVVAEKKKAKGKKGKN